MYANGPQNHLHNIKVKNTTNKMLNKSTTLLFTENFLFFINKVKKVIEDIQINANPTIAIDKTILIGINLVRFTAVSFIGKLLP